MHPFLFVPRLLYPGHSRDCLSFRATTADMYELLTTVDI